MLEDFIEINSLDAEIISFPTDAPASAPQVRKRFPSGSIAETKLFSSPENDLFLIITLAGKKPSEEKVMSETGQTELLEMNEDECFRLTGYKKGFLPPVSIFGVNVIIDSSLENKKYLFFRIKERAYLRITLEEILAHNENVSFAKITE